MEFFSSGIRRLSKGTYKIRIERAYLNEGSKLTVIDIEARILDGPFYNGRRIEFSFEAERKGHSRKLLSRDDFERMCEAISSFEIKDTSELIGKVVNIEVSKKAPFYIHYEETR